MGAFFDIKVTIFGVRVVSGISAQPTVDRGKEGFVSSSSWQNREMSNKI